MLIDQNNICFITLFTGLILNPNKTGVKDSLVKKKTRPNTALKCTVKLFALCTGCKIEIFGKI